MRHRGGRQRPQRLQRRGGGTRHAASPSPFTRRVPAHFNTRCALPPLGPFQLIEQQRCGGRGALYGGTIFAYGQTGAGKTYTMSGDTSNYQQRGVVPRAVHHIFREMDMRVEKEMVVRCSYLEIYNEVMYDLLADEVGAGDNLSIVERDGQTKAGPARHCPPRRQTHLEPSYRELDGILSRGEQYPSGPRPR